MFKVKYDMMLTKYSLTCVMFLMIFSRLVRHFDTMELVSQMLFLGTVFRMELRMSLFLTWQVLKRYDQVKVSLRER